MNDTILIMIDKIAPNPYQMRQAEDPLAVAELAANIEKNTLLQPPTVRMVQDLGLHRMRVNWDQRHEYEIAFGHIRLAAYKLLVRQDKPDYASIPCFVKDLSDLQMFEMAVAENIKRRDLNPIERARTMHTYMETFKKTSAETGEFFNVDESTVRGAVRLLGLPDIAQEKLAAGEITVDVARKLLTVQRIAGAEAVNEVVEELADKSTNPEEIINHQLKYITKGIEMWMGWKDQEKPLAGVGLWPLALSKEDFPNEYLPELRATDVAKALDLEFTADLRAQLDAWLVRLNFNPSSAADLILEGTPEDDIERLAHLIAPPACTACPFYARLDKTHYCAFSACHKRKVKAWCRKEEVRLSKKLGIPVYDPQQHGKEMIPLKTSWNDNGKNKKIFDAKTDVYLDTKYTSSNSMYGNKHDFTESYLVQAVLVGQTARKLLEKKKKADEAESGIGSNDRLWKIVRENNAHCRDFVLQIAVPLFASAFAALDKPEPIIALTGFDIGDEEYKKATRGRKLELLRQGLAEQALEHSLYEDDYPEDKGPLAVAKYLQGVAKTWGIKLPKDWLTLAEPYLEGLLEYEGLDGKAVVVSVETGKGA